MRLQPWRAVLPVATLTYLAVRARSMPRETDERTGDRTAVSPRRVLGLHQTHDVLGNGPISAKHTSQLVYSRLKLSLVEERWGSCAPHYSNHYGNRYEQNAQLAIKNGPPLETAFAATPAIFRYLALDCRPQPLYPDCSGPRAPSSACSYSATTNICCKRTDCNPIFTRKSRIARLVSCNASLLYPPPKNVGNPTFHTSHVQQVTDAPRAYKKHKTPGAPYKVTYTHNVPRRKPSHTK